MADQHQHHSGTGDNIGRDKIIHNYHHPTPSPIIPHDQPALDAYFLGRDTELTELLDVLHPGRVVTVCGPGGMGKSALAAQAVHQLAQQDSTRFPDGIVFHTFYGHPETEQALQSIIRAFGLEPEPPLDITMQRVLSNRKTLLILDGAEDARDLPAVLNLRGSCGVLITSRSPRDAQFTRLDLHPLEDKPAKDLLLAWSGQAMDEHTVQRICTVLGGLPVAVRIVGHYLRSTDESATEYLEWLEKDPLQELDQGEHRTESVAVLLRRSVEQLSDDARLVLGMAGCLAFAPIAREPITALLEGDARRTRAAINELMNYGLLEKEGERWQISHALIHTYACTELTLNRESLKQLAGCYVFFAAVNGKAGALGYVHLDKERAHCLHLLETCLKHSLRTEMLGLIAAIYNYLDRQGYWTDQLSAANMFLRLSEKNGNQHDKAWCLNSLGYAYDKRKEYAKALNYYKQSLAIRLKINDKHGVGASLSNIAGIYSRKGDNAKALRRYKQSLSIMQKTGDKELKGTALSNIAGIYNNLGYYENALKYLIQSLTLRQDIGDRAGEGVSLNNIGRFFHDRGDIPNALDYYKQAQVVCHEVGERRGETTICWNIGFLYAQQGKWRKSEEYMEQAVQLAEAIDSPDIESYSKGLAQVRSKRQAAQKEDDNG